MVVAPRRARIYVGRAAYVSALLLLMSTAWLVLTGTQLVRDPGDLARFGAVLFQFLALLQAAAAIFFSALLAASAVAQEKDRQTLVLLLLTHLSNGELVLGKLAASLLNVVVLLAAALPLFMISALLGGVSFGQIGRVFAVTLACVVACGSLGSTLALWREKTFQALAMTVLALVLWLAVGEIVAAGVLGERLAGISCTDWAAAISPWRASSWRRIPICSRSRPWGCWARRSICSLVTVMAISLLLNALAIAMVRRWNPSREERPRTRQAEEPRKSESIWGVEHDVAQAAAAARRQRRRCAGRGRPTRRVWDNPILWREIATWAYGRKMLVIRLAYVLLFGLAAASLVRGRDRRPAAHGRPGRRGAGPPAAVEPGAGQRPGRHLDDQRARLPGLGPAAGHRPDAQGNRLRQARRRLLQHQGDGRAAHAAVRISLVGAAVEPGEPAVRAWRGGRALRVRRRAGNPRRHELRKFPHAPSASAWGPCSSCRWAWPLA